MSADGKWKLVVTTPMGPREGELDITVAGSTFTGVARGAMGESEIEGKVDGDQLSWTAKVTAPMPLTLEFNVTFSGDNATGEVKLGMLGKAKVSGSRL